MKLNFKYENISEAETIVIDGMTWTTDNLALVVHDIVGNAAVQLNMGFDPEKFPPVERFVWSVLKKHTKIQFKDDGTMTVNISQ